MVRERERISLAPVDGLMAALKKGAKTFAEAGGEDAYFGDPTAASAEDGESLFEALGEILSPVGHGAPRLARPRSAGALFKTTILVRFGDLDAGRDRLLPEPRQLPPRVLRGLLRRATSAGPIPEVFRDGLGFPTVKVEMEFLSPVHYGDHVDMRRDGRARGPLVGADPLRGLGGAAPVFRARNVAVVVDMRTFRPRRCPHLAARELRRRDGAAPRRNSRPVARCRRLTGGCDDDATHGRCVRRPGSPRRLAHGRGLRRVSAEARPARQPRRPTADAGRDPGPGADG